MDVRFEGTTFSVEEISRYKTAKDFVKAQPPHILEGDEKREQKLTELYGAYQTKKALSTVNKNEK